MSGARFGRATPAAALAWIGVRRARRSTGNGVCEERGCELRGRSGDGGGIHAERRMCWEERPTGLGAWLGEAGGGGERNPGDPWAITWVVGWMVGHWMGKEGREHLGTQRGVLVWTAWLRVPHGSSGWRAWLEVGTGADRHTAGSCSCWRGQPCPGGAHRGEEKLPTDGPVECQSQGARQRMGSWQKGRQTGQRLSLRKEVRGAGREWLTMPDAAAGSPKG